MPFTHLALKAGAITLGCRKPRAGTFTSTLLTTPDSDGCHGVCEPCLWPRHIPHPPPSQAVQDHPRGHAQRHPQGHSRLDPIHRPGGPKDCLCPGAGQDTSRKSATCVSRDSIVVNRPLSQQTSVALGSAYFLSQALSPFAFSVLALTTIYIGSLAASSVPSDTGRVQNVARHATGSEIPKSAQSAPGNLAGSGKSKPAHPAPEYPVTLKEEHNEHHPHAEHSHSSAPARSSTPPDTTPPPPPLVTGYADKLKEEPSAHHSESGRQQHQDDTTAGTQHHLDTTTSAQHKPQHQRRASGQELRETNFSHRRVGSRGSADGPGSPTSPTKPFASSIPVATTLNGGGYRHAGSNW